MWYAKGSVLIGISYHNSKCFMAEKKCCACSNRELSNY